jgi:hypothetical protein
MRVAFLLANEARYRALQRVLGVSREQANLATAVVALIVAEAARDKARQLLFAPGGPTLGDVALAGATAREVILGAAGPTARDTPLFVTLVTIAVLGGLARPVIEDSVRDFKAASHRLHQSFLHRYGHLIGHHPHR